MQLPYQPLILAIANRVRGGWNNIESGTLSRLIGWGIPFASVLYAHAQPDGGLYTSLGYFLILIAAALFSCKIPAWGKWWHLGRSGNPAWKDWLMMSFCGLQFVVLPAIVVGTVDWKFGLVVFLSGLLIGPAYELGWRTPNLGKNFEQGPPMGEVYFGFLIGLAIYGYVNYI